MTLGDIWVIVAIVQFGLWELIFIFTMKIVNNIFCIYYLVILHKNFQGYSLRHNITFFYTSKIYLSSFGKCDHMFQFTQNSLSLWFWPWKNWVLVSTINYMTTLSFSTMSISYYLWGIPSSNLSGSPSSFLSAQWCNPIKPMIRTHYSQCNASQTWLSYL